MFKNLIPWRHKREQPRRNGDLMTTPTVAGDFGSLLNRFFDETPTLWDGQNQWDIGWGCDVEDADDEIVVRAEAPGFEPDEIDVQMSANRLVLQAEHKEERKEKNGHSMHYGKLYRTVTLPAGIEADKINAEYKNGILEVHLPKGPDAQTKRIPVKAK